MATDPGEAALRLEARQFGAYLMGIEPPERLVHRYLQPMSALYRGYVMFIAVRADCQAATGYCGMEETGRR